MFNIYKNLYDNTKKCFNDTMQQYIQRFVATTKRPSFLVNCKVNIDYQRYRAKDITRYFDRMKLDKEIQNAKILGWTLKNELTNGRWVMFGLAIGLLTEYATGVNFVDQIKLTISYL